MPSEANLKAIVVHPDRNDSVPRADACNRNGNRGTTKVLPLQRRANRNGAHQRSTAQRTPWLIRTVKHPCNAGRNAGSIRRVQRNGNAERNRRTMRTPCANGTKRCGGTNRAAQRALGVSGFPFPAPLDWGNEALRRRRERSVTVGGNLGGVGQILTRAERAQRSCQEKSGERYFEEKFGSSRAASTNRSDEVPRKGRKRCLGCFRENKRMFPMCPFCVA